MSNYFPLYVCNGELYFRLIIKDLKYTQEIIKWSIKKEVAFGIFLLNLNAVTEHFMALSYVVQ